REPGAAMEAGPAPGPDPDPDPGTGPAMDVGPEPVTGPVPVTDPATDPDVEPLHRGGFRCRLCQITAANRPSLLSHLAGKRHRRLRELRAERRAQELRSLFVSGFPRGTEPARLRQHFRAFGDVATVVMDKEKVGRGLRSSPGARGPLGYGLPQVEAQLALLVRALELSAAERRLRELLLALLREALAEFLPGCSLVPYGSSVNGFDVHGCDLDLPLELGGRDPPPEGTPAGDGDPQGQGTPSGAGDTP
ncbi:STPAP polymerase, partial [Struthidea cinerea]|nr:STPAP polymerase [Struthidea cinerea]